MLIYYTRDSSHLTSSSKFEKYSNFQLIKCRRMILKKIITRKDKKINYKKKNVQAHLGQPTKSRGQVM